MAKQKQARGRPKRTKISDQHMLVVDEYFRNGFRKTDALRVAGVGMPETHTYQVFSRPEVMDEIERRHRLAREKSEGGVERLIREYERIAYLNLGNYGYIDDNDGMFVVDLREVPPEEEADLLAALAEFNVEETTHKGVTTRKIRVKPQNKLAAMEVLARHFGMFKENVEVSGELSIIERIQEGRKRAAARKAEEAEDDGE